MSIFNSQRKEVERHKQLVNDHQTRLKTALWAGAVVVSMDIQSIMYAGVPWRIVDLILKVQPPESEAYIAKTTWKINMSSLGLLQPGNEISVKIDTTDPKLVYPNIQGAEFLI